MSKKILNESIELDFILIAITAPLKDYILCHKINKALDFDFSRVNDHEVLLANRKKISFFSMFTQELKDFGREYVLLSNKGSDGFLIEDKKWVDYFFLIHGFIDDEDLNFILMMLKKIPEIQSAALIDVREIKSKNNLAM